MSMKKRPSLENRVVRAAEEALARQGYVSAVDIFFGIGWLDSSTFRQWMQAQLPYLEAAIQTNPARISKAMRAFRAWATEKHLVPRETPYVSKTLARQSLRFTEGDDNAERLYRIHWFSPELSSKERERLEKAADRPPEIVVVDPLKPWKCHRCGGSRGFLIMESPGPSCLSCAGLGSLEFLPAGDAKLTRRAKAKSKVHAVVVRFSRSRKRYERQGLLVEPEALREAKEETGGA